MQGAWPPPAAPPTHRCARGKLLCARAGRAERAAALAPSAQPGSLCEPGNRGSEKRGRSRRGALVTRWRGQGVRSLDSVVGATAKLWGTATQSNPNVKILRKYMFITPNDVGRGRPGERHARALPATRSGGQAVSGRCLLSGGTPLSSRSQAHARTRKAHTHRVASYGSRSHARPSHSPHVHRPARPVWPGCPSSRARLGRRPRHAAPTGPAPPLGGPGSSCAANATPAVPGAAGRPRSLHDVTRPDRRKEQAPRSCKMQEKVPCPVLAGRAADAAQRL